MLHRTDLPTCSAGLMRLVRFQRRVLKFSVTQAAGAASSRAAYLAYFGAELGAWLYRKSVRRNEIIAIRQHVAADPTLPGRILEAFTNDITFHASGNSSAFRFQWSQLPDPTRAVVAPLMEAFYDSFLAKQGIPQKIHRLSNYNELRTSDVKAAFVAANPEAKACPACDHDIGQGTDADHYLPKSLYPFLSVHPYNLIPLCLYCNQRVKGSVDPIDDHSNAPLPNCFRPYTYPATDHINVLMCREAAGAYRARMSDRRGMPSRAVTRIDLLLDLESHWVDPDLGMIRRVVSDVAEHFGGIGRRDRRRNTPCSQAEFRGEIVAEKDIETPPYIGKKPRYLLRHAYLAYVDSNPAELDTLYQSYSNT